MKRKLCTIVTKFSVFLFTENCALLFTDYKWAKIVKTSTDTALRDIKDLVEKGILKQTEEGGRNANYELVDFKLK